MRRNLGVLALIVTVLAGGAYLATRASNNPRVDAHNLGVAPIQPIAKLERGNQLCQTPIGLPAPVDRVVLQFGTPQTKDPRAGRVEFIVRRDDPDGLVLTRKVLERGLMVGAPAGFVLDRKVAADQDVAICLRTLDVPVDVFGDVDVSGAGPPPRFLDRVTVNPTQAGSAAILDDENLGADLFLAFPRAEPSNQLAQVPNSLEHIMRFKPGGAWLMWVLLALGVVGTPAALALALREAEE